MSLIIFENFSELPLGSPVPPAGWTNPFGQFVVTQAPQSQGGSLHAARIFGGFFYEMPIPSTDMTLYFGFQVDLGNNAGITLVELQAQSSTDFSPVTILSLILETDRSISMQVGTKHIGNTADPTHKPLNFVPFYATNGGWFWIQVSLSSQVNRDAVGSISYFDLGLAVDGVVQFTGEFDPSEFDTGGTDPITSSINFVNFNSGIGFIFLREISAFTPHSDLPHWPFPLILPAAVNGKVSQAAMDVAGTAALIAPRVSQGVIEYQQNFKTRNIRIAQGVIEVLTVKGIAPKSSGWTVKEV